MRAPIFSIRIPNDLREHINELARQDDRSAAYIAIKLMREALARRALGSGSNLPALGPGSSPRELEANWME